MSWYDRFRRRKGEKATPRPSAESLQALKDFMSAREGVEAFVEPPTSVYAMTLCLVAADGEYLRRPVKDAKQARQLCTEHGVPLYDARIVGYPQRMREYDRGIRRQRINLEDLPPMEVTERPDRRED